MSDRHDFCRLLLAMTRKELTPAQRRRLVGAWSYTYSWSGTTDSGEYHVPRDKFYWHGSCCCAYHARSQGITAWQAEHYPEEIDTMTDSNNQATPIGEDRPEKEDTDIEVTANTSMTLKEARQATGHAAATVARMVGCDRTTLYRIESGDILPNRATARKLYKFYMGHVCLAMIYDPEYVGIISAETRLAIVAAPWGDLPTQA